MFVFHNMDRLIKCGTFISVIYLSLTEAFFSNFLHECSGKINRGYVKVDHTHDSITKLAVSKVIKDLIPNSKSAGIDSWEASQRRALEAILEGSRELDRIGHHKAAYHFNGEEILQGNALLISWRRQIIELLESGSSSPHKYTVIRRLIGQSLHLIQDFYSNTDYPIKEHKSDVGNDDEYYADLGLENRTALNVLPKDKLPCYDRPIYDGGIRGNIVHPQGMITSGYRSDQDVEKPKFTSEKKGKCSHGGIFDKTSNTTVAKGGINRESYNGFLSPRNFLHEQTSLSALAASQTFLHSVIGSSPEISQEHLLTILGVGVVNHVSIIYTSTLQKVITESHTSWSSMQNTSMDSWPWGANHLFTSRGDQVSSTMNTYAELASLHPPLPVPASQESILNAARNLPPNSDIVLVTEFDNPLEGAWDEGIMKKVLTQRRIRLTTFIVKHSSSSAVGASQALNRVCKSTQGDMFFVRDAGEILSILRQTKPYREKLCYKIKDKTSVVLPANWSIDLVVSCESELPRVEFTISNVTINLTTSTSYVNIYSVASHSGENQVITVGLPQSHVNHCALSTRSERALVDMYSVIAGKYDQFYPRRMRVLTDSRMVIEEDPVLYGIITPQRVVLADNRSALDLQQCMHDKSRAELRPTYMTGPLLDLQMDSTIDVEFIYRETDFMVNFTITEQIDTDYVGLDGIVLIPKNTETLHLVVTNIRNGTVKYSFTLLDKGDNRSMNITPRQHSAGSGEKFTVSLHAQNFLNYKSSIVFLLRGVDDIGTEFHAVHVFYQISPPIEETTTIPQQVKITTTTHRNIQKEDIPMRNTTASNKSTANQTISSGSNAMNKITLIVVISIVVLVAVLVLICFVALIYYCCKHKKMSGDMKRDIGYNALPVIAPQGPESPIYSMISDSATNSNYSGTLLDPLSNEPVTEL